MGLTRPKIWDLDTNIEYFTDPMLVLHTGPVTTANVDVGIVFNRAHGLVPNVAWYWSETLQSMVAALTPTGNTYVSQYNYSNVSVSSYANVTIGNVIANTAVYSPAYFYANGTPFTSSSYGNVPFTHQALALQPAVSWMSKLMRHIRTWPPAVHRASLRSSVCMNYSSTGTPMWL